MQIKLPTDAANKLTALAEANDPIMQYLGIQQVKKFKDVQVPSERLRREVEKTMSNHTIEFVNRAYELDLICRPGSKRFILVDGAAGYGKTYLLRKVKEDYEGRERDTWKAALVDLKSNPQMASDDSDLSWPCIAKAIVQQFGPVGGSAPIIPMEADKDGIAGALTPFLANQDANLLLLFDGVEILSRETGDWLKRLVYDLYCGLGQGRRELRVVFAGRYAGDWGRGTPYVLQTLSLSPFGRMIVRDMVEQVVQAANGYARSNFLDELTWWVSRISGGHPRGICKVLDVISRVGFIFPNLKYTFLRQEFPHNGQKGTLFELCIEPIIDEILQSMDSSLRKVLAAISPIRRFDQELLDTLLEQKVIDVQEFQSGWELMPALLRTNLISRPTAADPMYSDQIVRRILAMQMQINKPRCYRQTNERAFDIFHSWALGQNLVNDQIQRAAITESLYHILQLEPDQSTPGTIQDVLTKHLKDYLEGIRDMRGIIQLEDALKRDQELEDWVNARAGTAVFQDLLDVVERYRSK